MRMASRLRADVSVLYVRPSVSYLFKEEIRISQEKLEQWHVETEESRLLKGLEQILSEENFLRMVEGSVDVRHAPKAGIRGAYEYHLYGAAGEHVRIRIREGDIVGNIIQETLDVPFDLVLVGASGDGGRLVHQIIHYLENSVLIVKNPLPADYRFLLCMDDSRAARRAEEFCLGLACQLLMKVDVLSIYGYPWEEHAAMESAERTCRLLKHFNIDCEIRIRRGPVARTILREAQSHHIVTLGVSKRPSLLQFFLGSTPIKIGREGSSPVLVVK